MKNLILLKLTLFPWLISLLSFVFMCSVGVYETPNNLNSFLYLFLCLFLLCVGLSIYTPYMVLPSRKRPSFIITNKLTKRIIFWGCIAVSLIAFISLQMTGFSGDLEVQRKLLASGEVKTIIINNRIYYNAFDLSRALSIILLSLVFWTDFSLRKKILIFIFCFLGFIFYSLETGGRIHLLIPILIFITSIWMKSDYNKSFYSTHLYHLHKYQKDIRNSHIKSTSLVTFFKVILLISIVFILVIFFGIWSISRESSIQDSDLTLSRLQPLISFYKDIGIDFSEYFRFYLSYLTLHIIGGISHPLYSFEPFYSHYNQDPLFGLYNTSFISSTVLRLDWLSWKENIEVVYDSVGRFRNVWGTYVREFVVDFGFFGAPLVSFIYGVLINFFFKNRHVLLIFSMISSFHLTWLIMSIFYSTYIIRSYQMAYLFIFAWFFLSHWLGPLIVKKRRHHS